MDHHSVGVGTLDDPQAIHESPAKKEPLWHTCDKAVCKANNNTAGSNLWVTSGGIHFTFQLSSNNLLHQYHPREVLIRLFRSDVQQQHRE